MNVVLDTKNNLHMFSGIDGCVRPLWTFEFLGEDHLQKLKDGRYVSTRSDYILTSLLTQSAAFMSTFCREKDRTIATAGKMLLREVSRLGMHFQASKASSRLDLDDDSSGKGKKYQINEIVYYNESYPFGANWVEARVSSCLPTGFGFGSSQQSKYTLEILETGEYCYSVSLDSMEKKKDFEKRGSHQSSFAGRLPKTAKTGWAVSVKNAAQGWSALDCLEHIMRAEMFRGTENTLHALSLLDGLCATITASQSITARQKDLISSMAPKVRDFGLKGGDGPIPMAAARILSSSPGLFFSSSWELLDLILGAKGLSTDLFEELLQPFCTVADTLAWNFTHEEIPLVFKSVKSLLKRAFAQNGEGEDAKCSVALSCFQTRLALKCMGTKDEGKDGGPVDTDKEMSNKMAADQIRALFFSYCLEIFGRALVEKKDEAKLEPSALLKGGSSSQDRQSMLGSFLQQSLPFLLVTSVRMFDNIVPSENTASLQSAASVQIYGSNEKLMEMSTTSLLRKYVKSVSALLQGGWDAKKELETCMRSFIGKALARLIYPMHLVAIQQADIQETLKKDIFKGGLHGTSRALALAEGTIKSKEGQYKPAMIRVASLEEDDSFLRSVHESSVLKNFDGVSLEAVRFERAMSDDEISERIESLEAIAKGYDSRAQYDSSDPHVARAERAVFIALLKHRSLISEAREYFRTAKEKGKNDLEQKELAALFAKARKLRSFCVTLDVCRITFHE